MTHDEIMAASERASLAAFARAVLARSVQDNPTVAHLELSAAVEAGEISIDVLTTDIAGLPVAGWGV